RTTAHPGAGSDGGGGARGLGQSVVDIDISRSGNPKRRHGLQPARPWPAHGARPKKEATIMAIDGRARDLRVGIIGAGQAGERHAAGFSVTEGTKIVGIADVIEERAARLAGQFDAQPYADWRDMIAAGLDILVCSLPHNMHVEPTLMAA